MITLLGPFRRLVPVTRPAADRESIARRALIASVWLVVIAAPFERPIVALNWPPLVLTSVELAILVALLAGGLAVRALGFGTLIWKTPITAAAVTLASAFFLAALLSPESVGNALRFAARFATAGLLFLLVVNAVRTYRTAERLAATFVAIAAALGAVAVLEAAEVPVVMSALTTFRPGFHVVGGQLRATSTLGYPTTASMYLEVAFAWGLWLLVDRVARQKWLAAAVMFSALALIAAGIVATFTRAGLIGMAVALAIVAAARWQRLGKLDRAHAALGVLALTLVAIVLASRAPTRVIARWSTEGSQAWYGADYAAPKSLRLVPGGRYRIPIGIGNTGRIEWRSDDVPPFAVSYHWVLAGSERVVEFNGRRTAFPEPVPPGGRAHVRALVVAPATPGWYELVWDVVHEHRTWLSTEGVAPARTAVRVEGPIAHAGGDTMSELPPPSIRPDRLTLWRTAAIIAAGHPLMGIGPDNFRLAYGRYLGLDAWDTRVHANNMYLEVLVGAGVLGLGALVWLVCAAGFALARSVLTANRLVPSAFRPDDDAPSASSVFAALSAAFAVWITVAGHGLVDTFLAFTPTYVSFAVSAGLAFSPALEARADAHAHRV